MVFTRSTRECSVTLRNFRYFFILFGVFKGLLQFLIYSNFNQRSLYGKVLLKIFGQTIIRGGNFRVIFTFGMFWGRQTKIFCFLL